MTSEPAVAERAVQIAEDLADFHALWMAFSYLGRNEGYPAAGTPRIYLTGPLPCWLTGLPTPEPGAFDVLLRIRLLPRRGKGNSSPFGSSHPHPVEIRRIATLRPPGHCAASHATPPARRSRPSPSRRARARQGRGPESRPQTPARPARGPATAQLRNPFAEAPSRLRRRIRRYHKGYVDPAGRLPSPAGRRRGAT